MPKQLGPYKVIEEVGVGGLGRVFRAIDERTGRTVAIKILDKYKILEVADVERVNKEIHILK